MTNATDGAFFCQPTKVERFWRWAGFRYHRGDEPEGADALVGWMCTDTILRFGLADRIRLLLRGELKTRTISQFDTPTPAVVKNRLDWRIVAPGDK